MLTLRCSSQNDPLDCSSSVRIDLKQNLGNSGWEEKWNFHQIASSLSSIQEKFNFHQNAKSESLLTVPRTKIKCASSNPVGCLASPNTGDFARKKSTTGGKIQELWNAQFASPHISPGSPLGEADDKCILAFFLRCLLYCIAMLQDEIRSTLGLKGLKANYQIHLHYRTLLLFSRIIGWIKVVTPEQITNVCMTICGCTWILLLGKGLTKHCYSRKVYVFKLFTKIIFLQCLWQVALM